MFTHSKSLTLDSLQLLYCNSEVNLWPFILTPFIFSFFLSLSHIVLVYFFSPSEIQIQILGLCKGNMKTISPWLDWIGLNGGLIYCLQEQPNNQLFSATLFWHLYKSSVKFTEINKQTLA